MTWSTIYRVLALVSGIVSLLTLNGTERACWLILGVVWFILAELTEIGKRIK